VVSHRRIFISFYRFFPHICNAIRPFLPPLSVLVAALSAGAPLALNIKSVKSPFGFSIFLLAVAFHLSSFVSGYILSGFIFRDSPDVKQLQRTISFETGTPLISPFFIHQMFVVAYVTSLNKFICPTAGMQSSLLALALANKFFEDPVVGMPSAISVSFNLYLDSYYGHVCVCYISVCMNGIGFFQSENRRMICNQRRMV